MIAAALDDEAVDEMIARHGLKKFTPKTLTSTTRLKKRLSDVRRLGYAIADGEYKPDLCAIAVPIWDHAGKVVASLMTAIPSERSAKDKKLVESLINVLKHEAEMISRKVGFERSVTSN